MTAPTKNLILCLAANYALADIAPFVVSRRLHVDADVVVFSANMDAAFYAAATDYGLTVLDADLGAYPTFHPQTARFFRYQQFLAQCGSLYKDVLITDVRDVVFQGDPFAMDRDRSVSFAAEDRLIGECPINTDWLRSAYSGEVADRLADRPISCSGTTIGRFDDIATYIDLMCAEASSTRCPTVGGIDQGFHNYICYEIKPDFAALDESDHIINTVGYTSAERLSVEDGRVLVDGRFAPVVHQWDRHAAIARAIREAYPE